MNPGDNVFINFTSGNIADGQYSVVTIPDSTHFTITSANSATQNNNGLSVYVLGSPPLTRSGTVVVRQNTWNMGNTDGGASSGLSQTPLRSPTVFNFFFPDYMFPGILASAGLTTPEFQLTSDTTAALQMNFLSGGILNNTANTNGLSSFSGGNGSLVLDIGPFMTPANTSATGVPGLVDGLSTLLLAGELSAGGRTTIINYVTNTVNFPLSASPTATQMRDRVRAILHLLVNSPDYAIQR